MSNDDILNEKRKRVLDAYPSLRDQFAMAALDGVIQLTGASAAIVASEAYRVADAMLAEREKSK